MKPQLMRSELTGNVYIVTALNADGSARNKYDVTDQFHATAKALGIGQQEGVTVSRELALKAAPIIKRTAANYINVEEWAAAGERLGCYPPGTAKEWTEEKETLELLAAALSATQPPTEGETGAPEGRFPSSLEELETVLTDKFRFDRGHDYFLNDGGIYRLGVWRKWMPALQQAIGGNWAVVVTEHTPHRDDDFCRVNILPTAAPPTEEGK